MVGGRQGGSVTGDVPLAPPPPAAAGREWGAGAVEGRGGRRVAAAPPADADVRGFLWTGAG